MSDISTDDLDDQWAAAQEEGAERERKRIRRAQARALANLRRCFFVVPLGGQYAGLRATMISHATDIDAATRARRGR